MATKPKLLNWIISDDPAKISEPIDAKKANGFLYKERPAFQYFNWLFNMIDKWLNYVRSEIDQFSVEAQDPPSLSVNVLSGRKWDGATFTEKSLQSLGPVTAPSTDPRIDRVVLNRTTLVASIVTGTENPTPVAPVIPANSIPLARISINTTDTEILQSAITPEVSMFHEVYATSDAPGTVELATSAETITGTDTTRAVTPASLQAKVASETEKGIVELASAAEVAAGTDTTRAVTPANLIQYVKKKVVAHGSKSGNYTLDISGADLHTVEFTANATLTISSSLGTDKGTIVLKTNGYTITIAGIDNNPVTPTASVNIQDIIGIIKSNGKITAVGVDLNESAV